MKKSYAHKKLESLQVLRAIAFLAIFFSHAGFFEFGPWGVSVFFVLSGFVLIYSYWEDGRKLDIGAISQTRFAVKKIMRLYPLHICMMFLSIPIISPIYVSYQSIGIHILLLQSWVPEGTVYFGLNGVSWYLSNAFFLYWLFPLVFICVKRNGKKEMLCIFSALLFLIEIWGVWIVENVFRIDAFWFCYINPMYRLLDFLIGCNIGVLHVNSRRSAGSVWYDALLFVVVVLSFSLETFYKNGKMVGGYQLSSVWLPVATLMVWIFANNQGIVRWFSKCRALVYLGDISAYTYLVHTVVIKYIRAICERSGCFNKMVVALISLIVIIVIAEIYKIGYNRVEVKNESKSV